MLQNFQKTEIFCLNLHNPKTFKAFKQCSINLINWANARAKILRTCLFLQLTLQATWSKFFGMFLGNVMHVDEPTNISLVPANVLLKNPSKDSAQFTGFRYLGRTSSTYDSNQLKWIFFALISCFFRLFVRFCISVLFCIILMNFVSFYEFFPCFIWLQKLQGNWNRRYINIPFINSCLTRFLFWLIISNTLNF